MKFDKVFVKANDDDLKNLFNLHDIQIQSLLRGILLSKIKGKDGIDTFCFIHKKILEHFACL